MHPQTGEIKFFEEEEGIPKGWIGLDYLKVGKELTLHGLKFKIVKSEIHPGKPGKVDLKLEGMPNTPDTKYTPGFNDAMKAYKERTNKKEWE
jgi:hypothetical protein